MTTSKRAGVKDSLVALLVTAVGAPLVYKGVATGDPGLELVFFPVLAIAFGARAVSRR